jgi:putative lipoprotein
LKAKSLRSAAITLGALAIALHCTVAIAQPNVPTQPIGRWLAEDIRGAGVIDHLQTILDIAADGTISGSGGCNTMRGKATISGDSIAFGPIASTRRACPVAVMDQESRFFFALRDARTWRLDPIRRKLALLDAAGRPVVVFARM